MQELGSTRQSVLRNDTGVSNVHSTSLNVLSGSLRKLLEHVTQRLSGMHAAYADHAGTVDLHNIPQTLCVNLSGTLL